MPIDGSPVMSGCHKPDCLSNCCDEMLERVLRLENSPFGKSPTYAPLFEKLDKLEVQSRMNKEEIDIMARSISQLEKEIEIIRNTLAGSRPDYCKQPFKCPVCDGNGEIRKEPRYSVTAW